MLSTYPVTANREHARIVSVKHATLLVAVAGWLAPTASVMAAGMDAEAVVIRPGFQATSDYIEWKREGTVKTAANAMGPEKSAPTLQVRVMKRKRQRDGKNVTTKLTFDRLNLTVDSFRGPVSFDTDVDQDSPGRNPLQFVAGPAIGKSLTIEIDADTEKAEVFGMDDISLAIEETAAGKFVFEPLMPDFTTSAAGFDWVNMRLAPYPNRPVKADDTWTTSVAYDHLAMGTLRFDYKCKFKGTETVDGKVMPVISYEGKIVQPENARPGYRVFNIELEFKSGEFKGSAYYDRESKEFAKVVMDMHIEAEAIMLLGSVDKPDRFAQVFDTTTTVSVLTPEQRRQQRDDAKAAAAAKAEQEGKEDSD